MVHNWASSVADVLAIALADAGYHCYYTKAVCPRDASHDHPVFPTTLVRSAGKPKDSGKFKILQLSDIHLDEGYEEGARVDCKMPLCCRRENYTQFIEDPADVDKDIGEDMSKHDLFPNPSPYRVSADSAPASEGGKTFWSVLSDWFGVFTRESLVDSNGANAVVAQGMSRTSPEMASLSSDGNAVARHAVRESRRVHTHTHKHHHSTSHGGKLSKLSSSPNFGDTIANGARHFGEYTCDSPAALVESVLKEIPKHDVQHVVFTGESSYLRRLFLLSRPYVSLSTLPCIFLFHASFPSPCAGDAPAHDLWVQTKQANLKIVLAVTNMTLAQLTPVSFHISRLRG